jgi:predicted ATPase
MIVKKFRIQNYKSIIDSGDCHLEDTLTIFAGKNGCGKTTILEALEDFNLNREISQNVKSKGTNEQVKTIISMTFSISPDELNAYYKKFGMDKVEVGFKEIDIKKVSSSPHRFEQNAINVLQFTFFDLRQQEIHKALAAHYNKLVEVHNLVFKGRVNIFTFTFNTSNLKLALNDYQNQLNTTFSGLLGTAENLTQKKLINEIISSIISFIVQINYNDSSKEKSREYILNLVPNFILFKSFNEILPDKVDLDETLNQNSIVVSIQKIISCNFLWLKKQTDSEQKKRKDIINNSINEKYSQYWNQDNSKINIDWDENFLSFWIKNDSEYFKWDEESQGKQWHILFFLKVLSQSINGKQNIILIDEPGSSLHATAQGDIYKMLLESSQKSQVLFTTHSPYLIKEKELHKLRLVVKKSVTEGTKVQNQIHIGADRETLTPIMTAIGLSLNEGIHNTDKHYNVIVEGMSDVYYLRAFSKIIENEKYNFVFGGGSSKMGSIGAILNGWGCKTIYLFDNDKTNTKNDPAIELEKKWHVEANFILKVKNIIGTIEDIFTPNDYKEHVIMDSTAIIESTNGEYAKTLDKSKVIIAKLFLNKIEKGKIELEETTLENINVLFKKITDTFKLFD